MYMSGIFKDVCEDTSKKKSPTNQPKTQQKNQPTNQPKIPKPPNKLNVALMELMINICWKKQSSDHENFG